MSSLLVSSEHTVFYHHRQSRYTLRNAVASIIFAWSVAVELETAAHRFEIVSVGDGFAQAAEGCFAIDLDRCYHFVPGQQVSHLAQRFFVNIIARIRFGAAFGGENIHLKPPLLNDQKLAFVRFVEQEL